MSAASKRRNDEALGVFTFDMNDLIEPCKSFLRAGTGFPARP
jgi:hypothetical protein